MEYNEGKKGWVEVITGPMFAGKTAENKQQYQYHGKYFFYHGKAPLFFLQENDTAAAANCQQKVKSLRFFTVKFYD